MKVKQTKDKQVKCVLENSAWARMHDWLETFEGTEKGGVGLGFRNGNDINILAFLWPRQLQRSAVACEFDPRDLVPLVLMLDDLAEKHSLADPIGVNSWIHTHPRLGIFLSGTDQDTVKQLSYFDPNILAVVFDVFSSKSTQFKSFDIAYKEMSSKSSDLLLNANHYELFHEFSVSYPKKMSSLNRPIEAMFTPVSTYISKHEGDENRGHAAPEKDTPEGSNLSSDEPSVLISNRCREDLLEFLVMHAGKEFLLIPVSDKQGGSSDCILLVDKADMAGQSTGGLFRLIGRLLSKIPSDIELEPASDSPLEVRVPFDTYDDSSSTPKIDTAPIIEANADLSRLITPRQGSDSPTSTERRKACRWVIDQLSKEHGLLCRFI